ncbi:MAG: class I SAM-dependent methyltransferase [Candidatus Thorarchaeota archaeon]|nr:class I SAM-dependent methyltransferase [Candidatus Thorarchaeota archaeon]
MKQEELGWDQFWAEIFRVKHRNCIQGIDKYDEMLAEFCIEVLDLGDEDRVLDIACGAGDHAIKFAKKDLDVSAFDLSQTLISVAEKRAKQEGVEVDFYVGDMREMDFESEFDAAVLLSHSFGFFDHAENKRVLQGSFDALVDDGRLLLDLLNPYNLPDFQQTWTELEGGFLLSRPHVLDAASSVLRGRPATFIDVEGDRLVSMNQDALANNDVRIYTALEITGMLKDIGFKKVELYGSNKLPKMPYSASSERMVVVACK